MEFPAGPLLRCWIKRPLAAPIAAREAIFEREKSWLESSLEKVTESFVDGLASMFLALDVAIFLFFVSIVVDEICMDLF